MFLFPPSLDIALPALLRCFPAIETVCSLKNPLLSYLLLQRRSRCIAHHRRKKARELEVIHVRPQNMKEIHRAGLVCQRLCFFC